MAEKETLAEVLIHLKYLRENSDQTVAHLKTLNGRTATLETKVAVLEDRSPGRSGGIAGLIGGIIAGFIAGMVK